MLHSQWLNIKAIFEKWSSGNWPKKLQDQYNPEYIDGNIYDVVIYNLNAIAKKSDIDKCGDETTWYQMGYIEYGSCLTVLINGKLGITKGGKYLYH